MNDWFEEEAKPKRSRAPLVVVALVLVAATGVGGWFAFRKKPASKPPAIVAVDEPSTLEPLLLTERTPLLDEIFGTRMMNFTIGLDHGEDAEEPLHRTDVLQALGPRANGELALLIDAAKKSKLAANDDDAPITALEIATAKMDNALLASKLPYFVDTNVIVNLERGSKIVLMYEFYVANMGLYQSDAAKVRSVRVRRIDKLNWEHTLLGFVNPHRIYAVVLLDQIDELLVQHVLPGLAADSPLSLIAFDETQTTASRTIAARGGEIVREEMGTVVSKEEAVELGDALRARRDLFAKWHDTMKVPVKPPTKLSLNLIDFEKDLDGLLSRDELRLLRDIQKRLDSPNVGATFERLRDAFADSIERHEVQHRLDIIRPIPIPTAIDELLPSQASAVAERKRQHMQAELSAYLAQVGRDEKMARSTYTLLVRFLVDPRTRNSAEAVAARIATEEIAKELKIDGISPLVHGGRLDEERVIRAHAELTKLPTPKLAEAARKAWSRVFEAPFAPIAKL